MDASSKTLVIRFSSIGDIVLSTPLLRLLRARFPSGQIDYVTRTEYAELVRSNQNLNRTYEFDASEGFEGLRRLKKKIRDERYDLIVDIHDSLRSKYLRSIRGPQRVVLNKRIFERAVLVNAKKNLYKEIIPVAERYVETVKGLGIVPDGRGLELHIPDEVLFGVSGKMATLRLNNYEKVIGLCPGARHFTKRWPADRFSQVGAVLANEYDAKVLLFGGPEETAHAALICRDINEKSGAERATNLCGALSLLETASALEYCDVVVTNDTGLMHIAVAMQRNIVAVFGSTVREFGFFPYDPEAVVVETQGLSCRPCSHIGLSECPEKHFRCMTEIGTEVVCDHARALLSKKRP
ncbi:MAG TPA: lipopolysaccharide heptosyltransferase II [Bacteroidota bacterium]|nr:lipopolysaccharide heptosyltransferase II [Bacteroidota bacterium]